MRRFAAGVLVVATVLGACSGDDAPSDDLVAVDTTAAPPAEPPPLGGDSDSLIDPVDERDGPPSEEELDPPPPPSEICLGDAIARVSAAAGIPIETAVGGVDPSNREFCAFGDAAEVPLVRVRVTSANSDVTPSDSFATLASDPEAEELAADTVRVGRLAAHLGEVLTEVTVLEAAFADPAEAATVAITVLDALT